MAKSSGPLIIGLGAAALLLMGGKKKKSRSSGNFHDFSNLRRGEVTTEDMANIMSSGLTDKPILVVVTDRSNADLTNYVRDAMKWGASKRRDINFVIVDCNTSHPDGDFNCPTVAWEWEFGPPMGPSTEMGRVDESFRNAVEKIVEG